MKRMASLRRQFAGFLPLLILIGLAAGGDIAEPLQSASPATKQGSLAIIVNRSNAVENLSFTELRKIFLGERTSWPGGRKVTLTMLERGHQEREAVLRQIYHMSEEDFSAYFLHATFTGEVQSAPKELATPAGVRKFVSLVPGAIGCVGVEDVDDSVKLIKIDGLMPADPRYKLAAKAH